MSLLIKALASAERDKQAELNKSKPGAPADLALEPIVPESLVRESPVPGTIVTEPAVTESIVPEAGLAQVQTVAHEPSNKLAKSAAAQKEKARFDDKDGIQKAAANVFVAGQTVKKQSSPLALLALGAAGALIIWSGLQGYQYFTRLNAPQVTVKPASQLAETAQPEKPASQPVAAIETTQDAAPVPQPTQADHAGQISKVDGQDSTGAKAEESAFITDGNVVEAKVKPTQKPSVKKTKQAAESIAEPSAAPDEHMSELKSAAPLKLVSRTQAAGVDPTLLAAYQAFSRGDDASAQKQYRQVLQGDVRNVDALLGMAAIALRQSRYADANGWYQKVLEIEPRNTIALSAIANPQIGNNAAAAGAVDYVGTESRIKNMLAQQPEAANLHAALGNLYATQSQWAQAQAAYFNASRFAPNNADYAFNLAVSLDELGKPALALVQYQRALDLLNSSGVAGFDKVQLEARMQALRH